MARNDDRRAALADAGIHVLAQSGARGLTHRAVDTEAGTPRGTASNYFATRDALIAELVSRIGERLTPDPELLASRAAQEPTRELFATYIRDVVARLSSDPDVSLALFELRLEAARRPSVAEALGAWRRRALEGDVAFTAQAGLPGTRSEIALFHYAIDGLMLDRLTVPIDPDTPTDDIVEDLVTRLLA
jgi:DNA-binding transcriptional regulator YbjK